MSEFNARREAYNYILEAVKSRPQPVYCPGELPGVALRELLLLKEGLADPSDRLVSLVKNLLRGHVAPSEVEARLVAPFVKNQVI